MPDLERIGALERAYVQEVLDAEFRTSAGGALTTRLERAFAELVGVQYAVAFINGTATMHAALAAAEVGPGDEVIVPPLTMASTALAVLQAGAVPVFADVDAHTFNLDPASVKQRLTPRTRAIIPVALYGLAPELDALMQIAGEHGLFVLEDDAEAVLGAIGERRLGAIGHAASFSLQASKHLTSGEGGLITTNDGELAERIRRFNSLGYAAIGARRSAIAAQDIQDPGYSRHVSFGFNYRLPELCAAVALAQVQRADELVQRRIDVAHGFAQAVAGTQWLVPQHTPPGVRHTYWTYVLRLADPGCSWQDFRRVFLHEGGDPFYGAWRLTYLEPLFAGGCPLRDPRYEGVYQEYAPGLCPVAEELQPRLIQLKTNYWRQDEAERQAQALHATIERIEGG
ncbi:MAG TPA: DegT/DnrJ/EryC1/StrS family aminotransferase [Solirubrobacteraceae bacterium]|jgi:perosamine synthetase